MDCCACSPFRIAGSSILLPSPRLSLRQQRSSWTSDGVGHSWSFVPAIFSRSSCHRHFTEQAFNKVNKCTGPLNVRVPRVPEESCISSVCKSSLNSRTGTQSRLVDGYGDDDGHETVSCIVGNERDPDRDTDDESHATWESDEGKAVDGRRVDIQKSSSSKSTTRRSYLLFSGIAAASSFLAIGDGDAANLAGSHEWHRGIDKERGLRSGATYSVAMADADVAAYASDNADDEELTIRLFEHASKSVVFIEDVERNGGGGGGGGKEGGSSSASVEDDINVIVEGTGSGFVWDKLGHIVTNYHVISKLAIDSSGKQACRIRLVGADGKVITHEAMAVGLDPSRDLAVLKIDAAPIDLLPLAIGTSSDLKVGQNCYAIGNPFGFDHTLTTGIVSGLNRQIPSPNGMSIKGAIQTDAAINAGNSGGPLLDSFGRLIGVNTATFTRTGSGMSSGVNFAIPVDTVRTVVPQLIANGTVSTPP